MLSAFTNTLRIPELRARIFFTLAMIVIVRVGAMITLPGVNPDILQEWIHFQEKNVDGSGAAMAALLNVFSGGALTQCAIFALGIMPYISASIMMQLLTAIVPSLSRLSREDGGRQKITQYTRYATIVLCVFQGVLIAQMLQNPGSNVLMQGLEQVTAEHGPLVPQPGASFLFFSVLTMTAGTMLLMWLGEQITERGIGNGISIVICVNILSELPGALVQVWKTYIGSGEAQNPSNAIILVLLFVFLTIVIAGTIAITQAQRRIVIQHAKRQIGRKVIGGQTQYLPLKVNYGGVMPIIFAQAIMLFPAQILSFLFKDQEWAQNLAASLGPGSWIFYAVEALMIFFFSYFWVATMFQPTEISEQLRKNGGYIPGVAPGKKTADFLDHTMSRLTFAGAVFLIILAILPSVVSLIMNVPQKAAMFFGGTSLLILVGVVLDIMRQVETHLLKQHYDGFLRRGKFNSRFEGRTGSISTAASSSAVLALWVVISVLVVLALAYTLYRKTHGL